MDAREIRCNDATFFSMIRNLLASTGRSLEDIHKFLRFEEETSVKLRCPIRTPEELAAFVQADASPYDVEELAKDGRELALNEKMEVRLDTLEQIAGHEYPGANLPRPRK